MSRIEPIKPAAKFRNPLRTRRNSAIAAVVIVVVSVVAINFAIKSLSGTREYLVPKVSVAAGTPLNELQTITVSLNLGEAAHDYLEPGEAGADLTLTEPLAAGNLILKRNLAAANPNDQMVRLAILAKSALPSKLSSGSKVDLWSAANDGGGLYGEPVLIAQGVQVLNAGEAASLFAANSNKLELAVEQRDVKPILAAVMHGDAITVVAHDRVG